MQSVILLAIMVLFSLFMATEFSRNGSATDNSYATYKAENVAANIIQYNDLIYQYMVVNYDSLHELLPQVLDEVEQINNINFDGAYSQKNLKLFLNYQSIAFNYTKSAIGESQPNPELYLATTWSGYSNNMAGYKNIQMGEVMGNLGRDLSKHLYQGNSTYWTVPWVFSQNNCEIIELYTQVPADIHGNLTIDRVKNLFNKVCTQIQQKVDYKFLNYVYIQPVYKPENI